MSRVYEQMHYFTSIIDFLFNFSQKLLSAILMKVSGKQPALVVTDIFEKKNSEFSPGKCAMPPYLNGIHRNKQQCNKKIDLDIGNCVFLKSTLN